jgi:pilus assembly protein FimV
MSLKQRTAVALLLAGILIASGAGAAGLGRLTVSSALGQPLAAEVELLADQPAELEDVRIRLATMQQYKQIGMEFPADLRNLQFDKIRRPNGASAFLIRSSEPVRSPSVDLVLQLDGPFGSLVRRFVFLLDPTGYGDSRAASGSNRMIEPGMVSLAAAAPSAAPAGGPITAPKPAPAVAAASVPSVPPAEVSLAAADANPPRSPATQPGASGKATGLTHSGTARADAQAELRALQEAVQVREHQLQALSSAIEQRHGMAPAAAAAGAPADSAALAPAPALALATPAAAAPAQAQPAPAAAPRARAPAADPQSPASEPSGSWLTLASILLAAACALAGGALWYWRRRTAGAAGRLDPAGFALADAALPGQAGPALGIEETLQSVGHSDQAPASGPDSASAAFPEMSQAGIGEIDTTEIDPVAEADVYIAYGRHAQAEEILKSALQADTTRHAARVKLLELYAAQNNSDAFAHHARELRALAGPGPEWDGIAALGRRMDPANALYSGAPGANEMPDPDPFAIPKTVKASTDKKPAEAGEEAKRQSPASAPLASPARAQEQAEAEPIRFDLQLADIGRTATPPAASNPSAQHFPQTGTSTTSLKLAKVYVETGETNSARSLLARVLERGSPAERAEARQILDKLPG